MTNLKDKLSASVRQAKSTQQGAAPPAPATISPVKPATEAAQPAAKPPAASKPTAAAKPPASKPVAAKSVAKPAPAKPGAAPAKSGAAPAKSGDVQPSGSALFPARVWPD